jgi:hypothetical protein
VRADPEPKIPAHRFDRQSSIAQTDADRPISPNFFELEQGMAWIAFEQQEIGVSQHAN